MEQQINSVFRIFCAEIKTNQLTPRIAFEAVFGPPVGELDSAMAAQQDFAPAHSLSTHAPSTYKIPTAGDVPEHFKIDLWPEVNREETMFGSKAAGEPPLMLAISVFEALKEAIASARVGAGAVPLDAPATAENVLGALKG